MNLTDRRTTLTARKASLNDQLAAIAAQGDPIRVQIAVIDAQMDLLNDLIAEEARQPVPEPAPEEAPQAV